MSKAIDFVCPKDEAIANIKAKLSSLGIEITGENTINKGVGLKISLKTSQSGSAIVIYFNAKSGKSTKIVPENIPDNILKSLTDAIGTPIAEIAPSKTIIEKQIEQKSIPISLSVVLTEAEKADFKKKMDEIGVKIGECKKTEHMDYCIEVKENKSSLKISQFKKGKLLIQGSNSTLVDKVMNVLEGAHQFTGVERSLLYVPEKEQKKIQTNMTVAPELFTALEQKSISDLGDAYNFLLINDKKKYQAAVGLIEILRDNPIKLPEYDFLVGIFAIVYEGFIKQLIIKKGIYSSGDFKDDPDIKIGKVIADKQFDKYIADKKRGAGISDKMNAVWKLCRHKSIHSDMHKAEVFNSTTLDHALDRIGEIKSCIREAYYLIIDTGIDMKQTTSITPLNEKKSLVGASRIGTDESGKGDYLGPLVIAGVFINEIIEKQLIEIGVRDSKLISDPNIRILSEKIKKIVGNDKFTVVYINPEKYNELYEKMQNLNKLLAWGHARSIENILEKNSCKQAIADQFGDESFILNALMQHGKKIDLLQMPKAESDTAVAAASILARNTFITRLEEMSKHYGIELPKGASPQVEEAARQIVKKYGKDELRKVAKLHFKSTKRVLE